MSPKRAICFGAVAIAAVASALLAADLLSLRATALERIGRVHIADATTVASSAARGPFARRMQGASSHDGLALTLDAIDIDIRSTLFRLRLCDCEVRMKHDADAGGRVTFRRGGETIVEACIDVARGASASDIGMTATFPMASIAAAGMAALESRAPISLALSCAAALGSHPSWGLPPALAPALPIGRVDIAR
jgi:hypothetical protein